MSSLHKSGAGFFNFNNDLSIFTEIVLMVSIGKVVLAIL